MKRERSGESRPSRSADLVAVALAAAVALEWLILRTGTRTAIHIPALEALAGPYEAVSWLGRYAYYVAVVLLIVLIPALAVLHWRRGLAGRVAAAAIAVFAIAAAAARLEVADRLFLDMAITGAIALLAVCAAVVDPRRRGPTMSLFAAAFVLAAGFTIGQEAVVAGALARAETGWMLRLAEPLTLVFALSLPLATGLRPRRRDWVAGLLAGGVVFAIFLAEPATARFLLLWNEGLTGSYPALAYAMAGGAAGVAVSSLVRARRLPEAAAIVLLVGGGVGLHSTYQTGLVTAGLALLAAGPPLLSRGAGVATSRDSLRAPSAGLRGPLQRPSG